MKSDFRQSIWKTVITMTLLVSLTVAPVAAQNQNRNLYDEFRNREYTNKGYITEEEELKLAEEVHKQVTKQSRLVQGQAINSYISQLGNRLARQSERPNLPWQFYVVDDKSINAFATLGGRVYVHTGLIAATQTESQLASVLGHEIGHIVARHGLENVKKAQKYAVLGALSSIAGAIIGGNAGALVDLAGNLVAGGFLMKHSRAAEREADFLGLYNLNSANYNTQGMVEMFQILNQVSQGQPNMLGSIIASHPPPAERAHNTEVEITQYLPNSTTSRRISNSTEFQRIRGNVPTTVPPGTAGGATKKVRPRN